MTKKKKTPPKPADIRVAGCLYEAHEGQEANGYIEGWPAGIYSSFGHMTPSQARKLAAWLIKAADFLEEKGK